VGLWKVVMTQEVALSLVWNALNTAVFATFVAAAWREQRARRRASRLAATRRKPLDHDHDRDARVAQPVGADA
jgi:hypothetical protein